MKKNTVLFILAFGFLLTAGGCTSKKVDQEADDVAEVAGELTESGEAASDEISEIDADLGGEGAAETTDQAASGGEGSSDEFGSEEFGSDEFASDDGAGSTDGFDEFSEETGAQETATNETEPLDTALNADSSLESASTESNDLAGDTLASDSTDTLTDSGALTGEDEAQGLSADVGMDQSMEELPPAPRIIPLKKMITTPYRAAGVIVNALYVARPGDTLASVSQKIYGQDKTEELKKINSTFARREMKTGDKVYYNSPQRPNDETTVQTYYEDMGLSPEIYLSQPGDNIRTVAKTLLGHENSWKEIWATNLDVESKGELPEGTRLRYWTDSSSMAPIAATTAPTPTEMTPPPPTEPPPMPEDVMAQTPPPPEPMMESEPTPPPVPEPEPMAAEPPPPMPDVAEAPTAGAAMGEMGDITEDPDQMMAIGAGAVLLIAAIALFIIIRKKRAKSNSGIDFHTATHTQIE